MLTVNASYIERVLFKRDGDERFNKAIFRVDLYKYTLRYSAQTRAVSSR